MLRTTQIARQNPSAFLKLPIMMRLAHYKSAAELPHPGPLTDKEVHIIKSCVPILEVHGHTITKTFYAKLLSDFPQLHDVFNHSMQTTGHQAASLAQSVHAYAANIDNLDVLVPVVTRIAHKHASLNIQPWQYELVGNGLIGAIKKVLGDAVTDEMATAWFKAYWALAHIFIDVEATLLKEAKWTGWKDFKIAHKVAESDNVTSFYLQPVSDSLLPLPISKAGQYVAIKLAVPELGFMQSRQYSLSDSSHDDIFRISVKRDQGLDVLHESTGEVKPQTAIHPGFVSNLLHDKFNEGDIVGVSVPFGDFYLRDDSDAPVVLISAGVGVTPNLSILNSIVSSSHSTRPVTWVHGARNSKSHAFQDHLVDLSQVHPNVRTSTFYSHPEGSLDAQQHAGHINLQQVAGDLHLQEDGVRYYICGPQQFMYDMRDGLLQLGAKADTIELELFNSGSV